MTLTPYMLEGSCFVLIAAHVILWAATGKSIWWWISALFMLIHRAEITTYRWWGQAWKAWVDEFKHYEESEREAEIRRAAKAKQEKYDG